MKQWKIRKFLGDVIWDLRQRRLLPVIALLIVGLAVVPVVLAGGDRAPAPVDPLGFSATVDPPEIQSAVIAYDSGLRDYKRRLKELSQTDPFEQQFAPVPESTTDTVTPTGGGETPPPEPTSSKKKIRYVSYSTDLLFGEEGTPELQDDVSEVTFLPNEAAAVVVVSGVSADGKSVVFLVSSDVSDSAGDGECQLGCSLLILKPGETQTLDYTPGAVTTTYELTVVSIDRHVSSSPGASGASTKSSPASGAVKLAP